MMIMLSMDFIFSSVVGLKWNGMRSLDVLLKMSGCRERTRDDEEPFIPVALVLS